ncbi:MAG: ParB/RepB/Spo0J family partition protein [Chloroflexota bacterium]
MTVETRKGSGGLGRGLAALIPAAPASVSAGRGISIASVGPNPQQPRRSFDPDELQQLADSIVEHGVLQPILVVERAGGYTIIAGERRLRASALAGLETIPAIVRTANDQEQLSLALVENIQRSDLNALDEARGYRRLIDEFGLTQDQVAQQVGRSRPTIANSLRILEVAVEVQQAVADDTISGGHARALASLEGHTEQEVVLATVVARSLSVRQTERLVTTARDGLKLDESSAGRAIDPDMQRMEGRMREALGTKVTIASGRRGGRITIAWYDDDDLGRLVDRLATVDR